MDFRWSAEDEAFRDEVRSWLKEHLVGEYAALGSGGGPADETGWDVRLEWEKELGEAGWIGLGWPKEYGGRGATITQQLIFNEEYAKANAPARVSFFGEGLLGPTLIAFGTEEQKQLTGSAEFNEVFFTDARTSADLVVGNVNEGWKVAMGTLGFERGTAFLAQQLHFQHETEQVIDYAKKQGLTGDAIVRQKLADAWIGVQIMKYNGFRSITKMLATGSPPPEASISKLYWSHWHRHLGELEMELMGPWSEVLAGPDYELEEFQSSFLLSRAETIYTGSTEIQKNIIGERVLGLPREPAA